MQESLVPTYLKDLLKIKRPDTMRADGVSVFLKHPAVAALDWPDEVTRQWLWDHPHHFLTDYGAVDLGSISWASELLPVEEFDAMPTGASEHDTIEYYARNHRYSLKVREHLPRIVGAWRDEGSWLVPPVLISRMLLDPPAEGLQVVEGRTRVGILRGRRRDGLFVAEQHHAWVGRRSN